MTTKIKASISKGNTKMGKVPSFSTMPGKTCSKLACRTCLKECYAMKAVRKYKETRNAYTRNTRLALDHREELFSQLGTFLARKNPEFFRFHVAGDIPDQDYLDRMYQIARDNPDTSFLAFTKRYYLTYAKRPKNMTIVFSAWPGVKFHRKRGIPVAWMVDKAGVEQRHLNRNVIWCPGHCETCGMCWALPQLGLDVCFPQH